MNHLLYHIAAHLMNVSRLDLSKNNPVDAPERSRNSTLSSGSITRFATHVRNHFTLIVLLLTACAAPLAAQRRVPQDLSGTRGFNYQSAETIGHAEFWLQYNPAVTERDLDYAKRLQLNQVRVFVPYAAWERNKEGLRKNLLHFLRAAHARGIGVMPTMQYKFGEWKDRAA